MSTLTKACEGCGREFEYPSWDHGRRYCSRACRTGAGGWAPGVGKGKLCEIEAELIAAYKSGKSVYQIAEAFGVSAPGVNARLRKAGIAMRGPKGKRLTEIERAQMSARATQNAKRGVDNAQYKDLPVEELRRLYESGLSTMKIAAIFAVTPITVSRKLRQAGVTLRKRGYSQYRRTEDGHLVQSSYEEAIDNWLYEHGIPHEIQPSCPWCASPQRGARADFRVGNTYIEMWGIVGSRHYEAKRAAKLAQYRACGADLIQLFPHHILTHDFTPLLPLLKG